MSFREATPQTDDHRLVDHGQVNGDSSRRNLVHASPIRFPKVHVVLVNYRTAELVVEGLRALEAEVASMPSTRVTVVDNASGDGSAHRIAQAIRARGWQTWAELVALDDNGGFSRGNNTVLRRAFAEPEPPDYVWLLNPDTRVRAGALHALIRFMEQRPSVGIAGSRLEHADGTPQRSAFRFHTPVGELCTGARMGILGKLLGRWEVAPPPPEECCPTDWVAGASMLIRREVLESVGWLDERFFLYYEEVDYCLRAHRAGWECWYVPSSRVVHFVGQSTGVTDPKRNRQRRPSYWFQSRRRYFVKNYGWTYAVLADSAYLAGLLSRRLRFLLAGKRDDDPALLLLDLIRHSAILNWKHAS